MLRRPCFYRLAGHLASNLGASADLAPSLDARYAKIWDYSFYHPLSVWDTLVYAMRGNSRPLERYIVYRRVLSQARGPMETRRGNERQHRRA